MPPRKKKRVIPGVIPPMYAGKDDKWTAGKEKLGPDLSFILKKPVSQIVEPPIPPPKPAPASPPPPPRPKRNAMVGVKRKRGQSGLGPKRTKTTASSGATIKVKRGGGGGRVPTYGPRSKYGPKRAPKPKAPRKPRKARVYKPKTYPGGCPSGSRFVCRPSKYFK